MTSAQDWLRELDDPGIEAALVGNKAWRLARLRQAGFPVAPGFCLTTRAIAAWASEGDAVRARLLAACRELGGTVAVRSSAVEEDGEAASYAGIYHSELPVRGEQAVLAAVDRCIASWHAPEAVAYRRQHGDAADGALAVLIQRLVPAVSAGVAYTRAPLDPARREVHIDAVWGLAEPLAAGRTSADSYVVARSGRLLRRSLCAKEEALGADGPYTVAASRVRAPCLSTAMAREVASLARRAEDFFGAPQDVEFAIDDAGVWLLQSRPLAAPPAAAGLERYLRAERRRLAKKCAALRRAGRLEGKEVVFSNGNIGELLPNPTTMSFGLFKGIFAGRHGAIVAGRHRLGYRFDARKADHLYELVAGQACFNLELDAATFDYGASPPVDHYLERVAAEPALANYPEVKLYVQQPTAGQARAFFGAGRAAAAIESTTAFDRGMRRAAADFLHRYPLEIAPRLAFGTATNWSALDAAACASAIWRHIRFLRKGPCVEFVVAARMGFYFAARLRAELVESMGTDGETLCARLLSGLPGSLVTCQALWLEDLAKGRRTMADFLAAYGHTATNELELAEPRLAEQAERLTAMLRDLAACGRRPTAEFARQQADRIATETAFRRSPTYAGADPQGRATLDETLRFAQQLLPLRETIKHHYTAAYAAIRRGLLRLNTLLEWPDGLIFHLRPEELASAAAAPGRLRPRAERRAADHVIARQAARMRCVPAVVFGSRLEAIGAPEVLSTSRSWRGTGLAPGRSRGIARVLEPGSSPPAGGWSGEEILVVRAANLGLTPLFRLVAGVVVEVGGLLAHSACQAREAGIPAVALPDATRLIADGAPLTIDGSNGTVALLNPIAPEVGDAPEPTTV